MIVEDVGGRRFFLDVGVGLGRKCEFGYGGGWVIEVWLFVMKNRSWGLIVVVWCWVELRLIIEVVEGWIFYILCVFCLREFYCLISVLVKFFDYWIEEFGFGGFCNGELLLDMWFCDGVC